jgi:hypothetical protein
VAPENLRIARKSKPAKEPSLAEAVNGVSNGTLHGVQNGTKQLLSNGADSPLNGKRKRSADDMGVGIVQKKGKLGPMTPKKDEAVLINDSDNGAIVIDD